MFLFYSQAVQTRIRGHSFLSLSLPHCLAASRITDPVTGARLVLLLEVAAGKGVLRPVAVGWDAAPLKPGPLWVAMETLNREGRIFPHRSPWRGR